MQADELSAGWRAACEHICFLQIVKQALPWVRRAILRRPAAPVAFRSKSRGLFRAPVVPQTRARRYQQAAVAQDGTCHIFDLLPMFCFCAVP